MQAMGIIARIAMGRKGGKNVKSTENEIGKFLMKVGISPSILGYGYLKTAISIAIEDTTCWRVFTKSLYPAVAERHATTPSRAQRAMRHAIEKSYSKGNKELLGSIMLIRSKGKSKATLGEFIAGVAEHYTLWGDFDE